MGKRMKVFVVDDETSTRMAISFNLEEEFDVEEFSSGEACLDAMGSAPDLVLLDIEMPGKDGLEVCQAIRASGNADVQIIFISSHDDLETRLQAYAVGGNDYLVKPFVTDELVAKVQVAQKQHLAHHNEIRNAKKLALLATSAMDDMGLALKFLRACISCETPAQLADALFTTLDNLGMDAVLAFWKGEEAQYLAAKRACGALETSILDYARSLQPVLQLQERLVVNFPTMTLVATLPAYAEDRLDSLRNNLVTMVDAMQVRLGQLDSGSELPGNALGDIAAQLRQLTRKIEALSGKNGNSP